MHYPARTAAYLNMAALPILLLVEQGWRPVWALVAAWCLLFPHLARWLSPRWGNDRATEHRVMQLDSAQAALVAGLCGFMVFPSAVMLAAMLMNALMNGGLRFGLAQLPAMLLGGAVGLALTGFEFQWQSTPGATVIAVIGLASYVLLVGLNTHVTAMRLKRTRRELLEKSRALEEASLTDPLTRARNRRYISAKLGEAERAVREPLAFVLIDIDHFKRINDQHGHAAGDAVLRELAARLTLHWPAPHDLVRWGGEEFLLVVHGTEAEQLPDLGEAVREQVAARAFRLPGGDALPLTVSIGLAPYPFGPRLDQLDWSRVIDLADRALYAAKHDGRNTWVTVLPSTRVESAPMSLEGLGLAEAKQAGHLRVRRRGAAPRAA